MKKHKAGDTVWHAVYQQKHVSKTCPVCFGKLKVVVILGNEDRVTVACNYCRKGLYGPQGFVMEYERIAHPEQVTIANVTIKESARGETREYMSDCWVLNPEDIFDSKEAAMARATEKAKIVTEKEAVSRQNIRNSSNKSLSWTAGYHVREAKRCRATAERHEQAAVICKAKARPRRAP